MLGSIVQREPNPERGLFYELNWLVGGSQGDLAPTAADAFEKPIAIPASIEPRLNKVFAFMVVCLMVPG